MALATKKNLPKEEVKKEEKPEEVVIDHAKVAPQKKRGRPKAEKTLEKVVEDDN